MRDVFALDGFVRKLTSTAAAAVMALSNASLAAAQAQQVLTPPNIPINFGMKPDEVSRALGVQLQYVRGRPGDELLLAIPDVKGATLASRSDGLYLQFRRSRLSGWKGDWGTIRP